MYRQQLCNQRKFLSRNVELNNKYFTFYIYYKTLSGHCKTWEDRLFIESTNHLDCFYTLHLAVGVVVALNVSGGNIKKKNRWEHTDWLQDDRNVPVFAFKTDCEERGKHSRYETNGEEGETRQ